jgi:hypothetical protein
LIAIEFNKGLTSIALGRGFFFIRQGLTKLFALASESACVCFDRNTSTLRAKSFITVNQFDAQYGTKIFVTLFVWIPFVQTV